VEAQNVISVPVDQDCSNVSLQKIQTKNKQNAVHLKQRKMRNKLRMPAVKIMA
jgi:hypothetical protein